MPAMLLAVKGQRTTTKKARVKSKPLKRPGSTMADDLGRLLAGHPGDPVVYAQPSTEMEAPWLEVELSTGEHPALTVNCGKWLLFVSVKHVDEVWQTIRSAVVDGRLGRKAKVSTAVPNPNAIDPSKHVICVYTHDADDEADVLRVRSALRDLGFNGKLPYKKDLTTYEGKYSKGGAQGISRYYE